MRHASNARCGVLLLAVGLCFMALQHLCGTSLLTASAALIASSHIQNCVRNDTTSMECRKKLFVTLAVDAGQVEGAEEFVFIDSAVDQTNAAEGSTGSTVRFSPIRLSVSRSRVRYRYPLFYIHNFNSRPYERHIRGTILEVCNADFASSKATCGVAHDDHGAPIPYSQGFCCDCSLCNALGICNPGSRAKNACNVFGSFTTASCLQFDPVWYSGYGIGGHSMWYTLNVTVSREGRQGESSEDSAEAMSQRVVLSVRPDKLGDTSPDFPVSVQLVGDFTAKEQIPDLTQRILFVPALPIDGELVRAGMKEWMIFDKTRVTLDGRACNKIGVSYEAFAGQGNACFLNLGSCLGSQLADFRKADLDRLAKGNAGLYMVPSLGPFEVLHLSSTSPRMQSPYLAYVASSPPASMVTVTVNADELQYIVSVATGRISSATLSKETLQSSTRDGFLTVVVESTGTVVARFTVSVVKCSSGIFPIASRVLFPQPFVPQTEVFSVYAQDVFLNGEVNCTVELQNALEIVVDTRLVVWKVQGTNFDNGPLGSLPTDETKAVRGESTAMCPKCTLLDIKCTVSHLCVKGVGIQVGMAMLTVVVLCLACCLFRRLVCVICGLGKDSIKGTRYYMPPDETPHFTLPLSSSITPRLRDLPLIAPSMHQTRSAMPHNATSGSISSGEASVYVHDTSPYGGGEAGRDITEGREAVSGERDVSGASPAHLRRA